MVGCPEAGVGCGRHRRRESRRGAAAEVYAVHGRPVLRSSDCMCGRGRCVCAPVPRRDGESIGRAPAGRAASAARSTRRSAP
eukprot:5692503-Prymnesium_polylepis.1